MKAIITGMIATYPVGGVVWDYAQYALGLERLGWEVYYLEDTGWMTYDPIQREYSEDSSYGVEFLSSSLGQLSATLANRWHFRDMNGNIFGLDKADMAKIVAASDLMINVSGGCLLRDEYMACPRKLLIDTDPGWNHFRNYPRLDLDPTWGGGNGFRAHDFFFTYAERIGKSDCILPDFGLDWVPTRPLVVLDEWSRKPPGSVWTTVMTWKNFSESIEYGEKTYGTKEIEFEKIKRIPGSVPATLEIASGGDPPVEEWRELGWAVIDAHEASATPDRYRNYIEQSRGEFSIAKNVYVATRCGWFSCRSICYLAAGRPVVLQDTGFSEIIPCGEGVLAFNDLEGAVDAVKEVENNYDMHADAALEVAREYFASNKVLGDMLQNVGLN